MFACERNVHLYCSFVDKEIVSFACNGLPYFAGNNLLLKDKIQEYESKISDLAWEKKYKNIVITYVNTILCNLLG